MVDGWYVGLMEFSEIKGSWSLRNSPWSLDMRKRVSYCDGLCCVSALHLLGLYVWEGLHLLGFVAREGERAVAGVVGMMRKRCCNCIAGDIITSVVL